MTIRNCKRGSSRYKGISRGRPAGKKGLYVFQSPDAIHWTLIQERAGDHGRLLRLPESRVLGSSFPSSTSTTTARSSMASESIMTCTSDDFVTWSEAATASAFPRKRPTSTSVHERHPTLLHDPPAYRSRISDALHCQQGSRVEPVFMSSRNGVDLPSLWNEPVIPRTAPKDRNGNRSNYMANALVQLPGDDKHLSVYATEAYYEGPDSRLRRFEYRVDGFVSRLKRGVPIGGDVLTTRPLSFQGKGSWSLNFQPRASPVAPFEVGNVGSRPASPISGLMAVRIAEPIRKAIRAERRKVRWNGKAIFLKDWEGKTVHLRIPASKNAKSVLVCVFANVNQHRRYPSQSIVSTRRQSVSSSSGKPSTLTS